MLVAHARGDAPVVIDGRLDEPAWAAATASGDFIEREPIPRAKPPVASEVRVLFDAGALYVGVTMWLAPGETPRAVELTHDSFAIWADDAVTLKFDVRRDKRTTVGFAMNAAGAQLDYIALDNGRDLRREFDAVWQSAAWVGSDRWEAEFRLPVAALGLGPADGERVIGFQVSRDHVAGNATYDWAWMPPEYGAVAALYYGELRGVSGIAGGRPLAAIPYVLLRLEGAPGARAGLAFKAGGDLRLRIGPDAWAELTVLTDFAQVDLDDPVVNLDRFPLFLPEKRPFFLSGLEVFDFGDTGVAQLFFSRRIGLDAAGHEVPIIAGLKSYGRVGPVGFGVLDVLTQSTGTLPGANYTVARVRREAGDDAYVGAIVALKESIGSPASIERGASPFAGHYALGVDGATRLLADRLELRGWVADTAADDSASATAGLAAGASAVWRADRFRPSWSALYVADGFDPQVGFVHRAGYFENAAHFAWVERTAVLGLEAVALVTSAAVGVTDEADRLLKLDYSGGVEWSWRTGWGFQCYGEYVEERVDEDFELVPGVVVPAGTYRGAQVAFHFYTPERKSPQIYVDTLHGAFFGGGIHSVSIDAVASFSKHVRLTLGARGARVDLVAYDPFLTFTLSARLTVAPTRNLQADAIFLLNTVDEAATALLRVRWRFLAGSDLFLVYRHDLGLAAGRALDGVEMITVTPGSWSVTLKGAWRFDLVI